MDRQTLSNAIGGYARRLHARAGSEHHVLSALGAWILLALFADLADEAPARSRLGEILGIDPETAAICAAELLAQPHPLVAAAAGVWFPPRFVTPRVQRWREGWPTAIETGDLPSQTEIDRWCVEHTLGMIERFPVDLTPDVVCLLATALATRVSWDQPFDVVDVAALGQSRWSSRLRRVLRAPRDDPRHHQFVVDATSIGQVAVHLTGARGGVVVGSVIAADPSVPASEVLTVAHQIVCAEARTLGSTPRISLFELPLGDGAIWSVSEEEVETAARDGREEHLVSVLPAWSAESDLDLAGSEELGFAMAAVLLAEAFGVTDRRYEARQAAVARYSAVGFEAAAVTGLAMAMSRPLLRPGRRRDATIRFAHPYGVVAAGSEDHWNRSGGSAPRAWCGIPLFSAWVSEPCDADNS